MKIHIDTIHKGSGPIRAPFDPQILFLFGERSLLVDGKSTGSLRELYPTATLFGCSTSGEIAGTRTTDSTIVAAAVSFDHTETAVRSVSLETMTESYDAGVSLGRALARDDIVCVLVLSDGVTTNGSDLARGLRAGLPAGTIITGGLAGDAESFMETVICAGDSVRPGMVAALGLYGKRISVGYGSQGGWDPFGPDRLITRSTGNVLFDLDSRPALELYKTYLGPHAKGLPSTALYFPLNIRDRSGGPGTVRTILGVNEDEGTMTFAGDVPQGCMARFMKANIERVINGAMDAAKMCRETGGGIPPDFALCISCVGRKMVLKQRVEEEIEAVSDVFGPETAIAGFYSYGEIAPSVPGAKSELHNQTMTITTFREE